MNGKFQNFYMDRLHPGDKMKKKRWVKDNKLGKRTNFNCYIPPPKPSKN